MACIKNLSIVMRERRAQAVVILPFGKTRFYKSRAVALGVVALQRAAGRPAFIFPSE